MTGGVAIGEIRLYHAPVDSINESITNNPGMEAARFQTACKEVCEHWTALSLKLDEGGNNDAALILRAQKMLLLDEALTGEIRSMIENGATAEHAVASVFEKAIGDLKKKETPAASHEADLSDIQNALTDALTHQAREEETDFAAGSEQHILVASKLTPYELLRLDTKRIAGLVLLTDAERSHTVLLAKSLSIPVLLCAKDTKIDCDTSCALLDAETGCLTLDANEEDIKDAQRRMEVKEGDHLPEQPADNSLVNLYVNVNTMQEAFDDRAALSCGIGLLRTEFLFASQSGNVTEEEQMSAYGRILKAFSPKPVTIRIFDTHAEKRNDDVTDAIIDTQLRALIRASVNGSLTILIPMVKTLKEVQAWKQRLALTREALNQEGITGGTYRFGVMIETLEAVSQIDEIAQCVDAISIGSNDLLRALEGQGEAAGNQDAALMEMIKQIVRAANAHEIPVCLCGDLATDERQTQALLKAGVANLSVPVQYLLRTRKHIRELHLT